MYEQFFGLEDEPFRLTPDPRYLFLSPKHAEALAHLRLGLTESSGFVCITGEVGTGKTTLLRVFLSELGSNVAAAYIVVPPVSAFELLRRLCHEFGLPVANRGQTELIEELHAYLLAQHAAKRICVVVIDEAQALSIELLEQVRLLLNLETETQKLLRIVLVGQPQLRKLLLDPDLAQLNQRITLRWHLGPLSYRETVAYVGHRLAVASGGRASDLFTRPALRLLHSVAGGVPRIVNMIAHRALLAAFVARQPRVNRRVMALAYREIQAVPLPGTLSPLRKAAWAAAGLVIGVGVVALGGPQLDRLRIRVPTVTLTEANATRDPSRGTAPSEALAVVPAPAAVHPGAAVKPAVPPASGPVPVAPVPVAPVPVEPAAPAAVAAVRQVPAPVAPAAPVRETSGLASIPPPEKPAPAALTSAAELAREFASTTETATARAATTTILGLWRVRPLGADELKLPEDLEAVAWSRGLQDLVFTGNRSMVRLLDLPALLALQLPGVKGLRFAALTRMDTANVVLSINGVAYSLPAEQLDALWSGEAHVLWRDFDGLGPVLRRGARGVVVAQLQHLLRQTGSLHREPTGVFDPATEAAVLEFQRAHQLYPDALVGPFTRIVLYGAAGGFPRPTLAMRTGATS